MVKPKTPHPRYGNATPGDLVRALLKPKKPKDQETIEIPDAQLQRTKKGADDGKGDSHE